MGIEPTLSAWKAEALPLNYTCISSDNINYIILSDFFNYILYIFVFFFAILTITIIAIIPKGNATYP